MKGSNPLLKAPRAKAKSVVRLKREADLFFSRYVRYRDGKFSHELQTWVTLCITCGQWKPLKEMQAGHFVSRAVNVLRFDPENVNGQCYVCNVIRHGDLYEYSKALDAKYGEGTAEKLNARKNELHSFTRSELEKIIEDAKGYIFNITGKIPKTVLDLTQG
jgi:hypothetical protein